MSKLVECKSCQHKVGPSAKTCPSCGVSKLGVRRSVKLWALFGIFLVIAINTVDKGAKEKADGAVKNQQEVKADAINKALSEKAQEEKIKLQSAEMTYKSSSMAQMMAKEFVKANLKAPSTADFPLLADSTDYLSDCVHVVRSHVDAQNAFGAKLRSPTMVKLKYDQFGDKWIPFEINVK